MASLTPQTMTLESFQAILARYPDTVPPKLTDLDELRYNTIPTAIARHHARPHLTKPQVEQLVEWKLKHGTFRPKLLQLVQSNAAAAVQDTTRAAFQSLQVAAGASPVPALKTLTALQGVGPATASLLLSVFAPGEVPFFSDELFRWCFWGEDGRPGGWRRVIKYSVKEYEGLVGRVEEVRRRLGVRAVDVERVAWVLGREGVDVGGEGKGEAKVEGGMERGTGKGKKTENNGGVKRKMEESKPATEGSRRSSRRKTGG